MDYKVQFNDQGKATDQVFHGASGCVVEDGALIVRASTGRAIAVFAPQEWHSAQRVEEEPTQA